MSTAKSIICFFSSTIYQSLGWNKFSVPIWSPWEPNLSHRRRGCQLGLLSINFVFRNVIFQPMVIPFVWAKYKRTFMRERCKLSFPLPLAGYWGGTRSPRSCDRVRVGGGGTEKKIFFRPFWPQFRLKIRGRAPRAPPLNPPLNCNIRWISTINGMPMTLFFVVWTDFVITDRSILSFSHVGYSVLILMSVCVTLFSQTRTQSNLY